MNESVGTPATRSRAPLVGAVIGVPILAIGIWGAIADRDQTHPVELAKWVVASDLAHDLLAAPIIVAVAWLVGRLPRPELRAPLRWGLAATGVLVLYAWPFFRGYGRNPSVPSLLNRNYAAGLAAYVAVVWVVAIAWGVIAAWQRRRRPAERG